jgi:hypothetical protein
MKTHAFTAIGVCTCLVRKAGGAASALAQVGSPAGHVTRDGRQLPPAPAPNGIETGL